ncbi:adenylosuccinate lyase [bacterium]|nr:adenylosuccinate lyase [bacterium]
MINRYSRPEMKKIWEEQNRYHAWMQVELAVCDQLSQVGLIPKADWTKLKKAANELLEGPGIDPKRVEFHEKTTRHDVIAFTTTVAEALGPISRYIHYGLTSSDVVDTALSLQIQEAGKIILEDFQKLLAVLKKRAQEFQDLPTIGRSHGIFAEPTSFGLKFLGWYCEWQRNLERFKSALDEVRVGKLSGAVGVNAHWEPEFEDKVLQKLGLKRESVSTQVIPRDRHAQFLNSLAVCGSSLERMAVELRHLQRTEVGEVMEGFSKGQKGSSAMPHKRNPISSENLTGCARLLRSYAQAGLEDVALWHERDISHSSVERVVFPDALLLLDYAMDRMTRVLEDLVVNKDRVKRNLENAGEIVFSGHYLLELVKTGATREDAYKWVQECALQALEGGGRFVDLLSKHPEIKKRLKKEKIQDLGSIDHQLRNVREIYRRAGVK